MIVVIAIVSTLAVIATLRFSEMNRKHTIETETKAMYTMLMEVRQQALLQKARRSVKVTTGQLNVYPGTDTSVAPIQQKMFTYPVAWSGGGTQLVITYDTYGMWDSDSDPVSICMNSGADNPASVDSVVVTKTKVSMGKRDSGGGCAEGAIRLK